MLRIYHYSTVIFFKGNVENQMKYIRRFAIDIVQVKEEQYHDLERASPLTFLRLFPRGGERHEVLHANFRVLKAP